MLALNLIAIFALATAALALPPRVKTKIPFKKLGGRIIDGEDAVLGQIPHQVGILETATDGNLYLCGGSLIDQQWVVTAGHCVSDAVSFQVILGSLRVLRIDPDALTVSSSDFILHSGYDDESLDNDIGLIKLPAPVELTENIQTIALAEISDPAGTLETASGWGLTADDGDIADTLQFVQLSLISNSDCEDYYFEIGAGVICANSPDESNKSTCEGDSGGPLFSSGENGTVLQGVVSFGGFLGCEWGFPQGFTRVAYYTDWIRGNIAGK